MKNKTTAGILAIFLGGLGIHKFYLGRGGMGVLYLLFAWTFIPAIVGFIEGIILLVMNDHEFNLKYNPGQVIPAAGQPQNIVVNVANTATSGESNGMAQRLKELHDLKSSGALTDEEYEAQKQKVLTAATS
jgi:TM2 domain-containing membrane protein YozV